MTFRRPTNKKKSTELRKTLAEQELSVFDDGDEDMSFPLTDNNEDEDAEIKRLIEWGADLFEMRSTNTLFFLQATSLSV